MKKLMQGLGVLLSTLVLTAGVLQAQDQNIVEIAVSNEDFSTLVTAVQEAGLVDVLSDPAETWTVFAPTNEAFAALPEGLLESVLADRALLTRILTYHVLAGAVTSDQLSDMSAPSMEMTAPGADLMGSELAITIDDYGTVMVNDATVITADIIASNGVIHVIDRVLLPPDVAAMVSDMMMEDMMSFSLFATQNPAELANDSIIGLETDLSATLDSFTGFGGDITSIESVQFTVAGDAWFTFDAADGAGGIGVIPGLAGMSGMDMVTVDRVIFGPNPGLVMPKGIEVIESLDLIVVSNFGAANIKGFSIDAEGDVLPLFVISDLGGVPGSIWDTFYDAGSDTLFAAGTAGSVLVYEAFSETFGANGPDRILTPADETGAQISINLHGIAYVPSADALLLTDVGSADDASDGQIFVLSGVSMAEGSVIPDVAIAGPESMLGNPVDLVWDGSGIYIAEKANDVVLYYANILDATGMMDAAADIVLELTKPESLAILPAM